MKDNRNYYYEKQSLTKRSEFLVIKKIIGKNKKVIDLGCGDGTLMQILKENNNRCKGVEISQSGVDVCKNKKLDVIKGKIDNKLPFKDKEFDFAVCNVTMHMVVYPEVLIKEMRRVSKKQIVTFPNFAFILNRFQLMFTGTFPKWSLFGYEWYSTGHIHQLSIKDFTNYCNQYKINILNTHHLFPKHLEKITSKLVIISQIVRYFSNLISTMAIFVIE